MAHNISIRRDPNGNLEVQCWNPRLNRKDSEVIWTNMLDDKEVVTVFFPYTDPKHPIVIRVAPGRSSPPVDIASIKPVLKAGDYPYSVLVDDGAGHRTFVHHNDPKIILW